MNHAKQKRKQKHHHPPDYPGGLEDIAQRNTAFGKRLVEVLGAGECFRRHLQPIKLAPLTLESGYEFISRCLSAFGLLVAERLKWRLAHACGGHPRKLHLVCESLLISAWERGEQSISDQQCQYALQSI